jgi:hypothetical protein
MVWVVTIKYIQNASLLPLVVFPQATHQIEVHLHVDRYSSFRDQNLIESKERVNGNKWIGVLDEERKGVNEALILDDCCRLNVKHFE